MAKQYKPRTQKQIQNLSRAINKLEKSLSTLDKQSTLGVETEISEVNMGINDFTYKKEGVSKKIRYDQLDTLSKKEQAALRLKLSADRYSLRQQRAVEILKEKGKLTKQFKRSILQDNPKLSENIQEFEDMMELNKPEQIKEGLSKTKLFAEDWMQESEDFFSRAGSDALYDFFRPDRRDGFSERNEFTWNVYKMIRGI